MKFCAKCGSQMDDAQRFCPGCGFDMGAGQNTSVSYYNGGQDQYYGGQQQSPYDYVQYWSPWRSSLAVSAFPSATSIRISTQEKDLL